MKRLSGIAIPCTAAACALLIWTAPVQAQQRQSQQQRQQQDQGEHPLPRLREDASPLPQDVKVRTSFAPVAKKVAPSVVNVYSTRKIEGQAQSPLGLDPFFRRFFGGDDDNGSSGPSARPRRQERQEGLGSGVIISEDGYIITNNHVVEDSSDIRVALVSGEEYPATVVGTDPATDIAVLKVDRTGLPAIVLGDSSVLEVGDSVLAVGNPFGIGQTVTLGIVSGLGRAGMGIVDYEDFIQTDASINPGNSGGALIDVLGRLIGINTAILSRSGGNQGVGFAVPINIARTVMEQIIEHGHVTRGYLGIYIQPLTPDLARAFNTSTNKGALVASVTPKSPASKAGLKEGDVITEFNGKEVPGSRELRLMAAQTPPNTRVPLHYLRNGKPGETTVTLGELHTDELARGSSGSQSHTGRGGFLDGVQVADLDAATRRQYNLPGDVEGVVVTDVDPGSAAERAGLTVGDVIEEVNRQPVRSLSDATSAMSQSNRGSALLRVRSENGGTRYVVVDSDNSSNESNTRKSPSRGNNR